MAERDHDATENNLRRESADATEIVMRHMDAASREAMDKRITPDAFALAGVSYLVAGLVLGSSRWSAEQVAEIRQGLC